VYALGTIVYEFTTGQPYSQVQLPPAAVRPGFPPKLAGILLHALASDPGRRTPAMAELRNQCADWLAGAEAAGWGEEALPGFRLEDREAPTLTRANSRRGPEEGPSERLDPYLDALKSGAVGSRRAAADGLRSAAQPGDEAYLLEALALCPEGARFALVGALGEVGGGDSLAVLLGMLRDPFAKAEAAEAASLVALRSGRVPEVLAALLEPGLGTSWRWSARARLGDAGWAEAFRTEWPALPLALRVQALGAAQMLPEALRARVKAIIGAEVQRAGGNLKQAWDSL
jgi:hypothetical protein